MTDLSDVELELLHFERSWWSRPGAKEQAIRNRFGLSSTAYWQRVNALIDRPEALAAEPVVVGRLRRMREQRLAARRRP